DGVGLRRGPVVDDGFHQPGLGEERVLQQVRVGVWIAQAAQQLRTRRLQGQLDKGIPELRAQTPQVDHVVQLGQALRVPPVVLRRVRVQAEDVQQDLV